MIIINEVTQEALDKMQKYEIVARDPDHNLEKLLTCIKDLSTAGHSFVVVVDPDADNSSERTFEIDGDGCDQLYDIKEITKNEINTQKLNESNGINKVILKQKLKVKYETNIDYDLNEEDLLYNIDFDDKKFSEELQKYLKEYNMNDEYREVYNSVTRVESDFDNNELTIYITLGVKYNTEKLQYIFENFIEEVALEDDQFSGTCNVEVDEFESEPYETSFNSLTDEIGYSTSTIDEIEVDYSFKVVGEQTTKIEQ